MMMPRIGKHHARRISRHRTYGTPHEVFGIDGVPMKGSPQAAARAFLRGVATTIGTNEDLKDLKFDKVIKSPLGSHVLFQQRRGGKSVTGAWVKVDLDHENRVYHFTNSCVPVAAGTTSKGSASDYSLDEAAALRKARAAVGAEGLETRAAISAERVLFPVGTTLHPAWKFIIPITKPPHDWRIYISGRDGSVLGREDMLKMITARGQVFDPNPVVTLNDCRLRETRPIPEAAYRQVDLPGVPASGLLDGPHVTTRTTKQRVRARDGQFIFERGSHAFLEVMAYFHIDRLQRYIQSLGFDDVNRRATPVNVAAMTKDNSYYSPATRDLSFGLGGVPDAEDAEVILHEYGHAIQDAQVPGFGSSDEAAAMGEGFGDYLAASFFADAKPDRLRTSLASWDATYYSDDDPPCLRRVDSTKRYPRDMVGEPHGDGEIWSACLWLIREALGRQRADVLVIAHHFLIRRDASFSDAVEALVLADQRLNGGANENTIRDVFIRRGILKKGRRKAGGYDPNRRDNRS
jgi:hypothetical protein